MNYARTCNGARELPTPGAKAVCPGCRGPVLAKCGSINVWHWAHKSGTDCDKWSEPETAWHREWKNYFSKQDQEIIIGPHRADVKTKSGRVIELQHSPISATEIKEREDFYGPGMVWVVDATPFLENIYFLPKNEEIQFIWRWFRKSWQYSQRPVYLDPGSKRFRDKLFRLKRFDQAPHPRYAGQSGWGSLGCKYEFLRFFSSEATVNANFAERFHRMHEREIR